MSVYGPNQVEEVTIGTAVATEGTVADFKATASEKEIKALAIDGGTAAEGKEFYFLQKTGAQTPSGYEFTDTINPKKIDKIVLKEYSPEVQKEVTVTGFDANVVANTTYAVNIRLYNEGGSLSPENFRVISGYYTTGSSVTNVTGAIIRDAILANLEREIVSRGDSEFVFEADDTTESAIVIKGKYQKVVPGKITGRQTEFDVTTKTLDSLGDNTGLLSYETTQEAYPGNGTGKQVVNKEWFAKGYKYDALREIGYPNNFDSPYYADGSAIYNTVHIIYKDDRISPTVEEYPKVSTVYIAKSSDDNPGNAGTNSFLADLRVFVGDNAEVPADLTAV